MSAVAFDTYKFIRTLKDAGIEEKRAEAVSTAFSEAQDEAELAKKSDIRALETQMHSFETGMNARMDSFETGMNARMDSFETGINARMDTFETRMSTRMDTFETGMNTRMDVLETKMGSLDGKLDSIRWILLILVIAVIAPAIKGLL
uniref:DUF1640 domain-containing protein n=1 Tax=Candidatus Kentrum sp. FW TaxID=2126338 RepID=A0A450SUS1_9GAMM|nr:MAG: hypothetical protein BECKFW1821B_GA0114236_103617 [Candidatus Kentron sp. FW]